MPYVLQPCVPVPLREGPTPLLLKLSFETIAASFPSQAEDYVDASIEPNVELILRQLATCFTRLDGEV